MLYRSGVTTAAIGPASSAIVFVVPYIKAKPTLYTLECTYQTKHVRCCRVRLENHRRLESAEYV